MTRTAPALSPSIFHKGKRKFLSATALTAIGLALASPAQANDNAWSDFEDVSGSITIDTTTPNTTLIDQHTQTYIGNSNNLDILQGQTVTIGQNNTGSLFVGRSTREGSDPTRILGNLNTRLKDINGNFTDTRGGGVIIQDRNGVLFGENSRIDVGGILATTGEIDVADILNGIDELEISNFGDGSIDMQGEITVADAGLAAFVSPTISNSGVINAKMGKVVMASGEKVTLDLYGDNLIEVAVDGELADALIENSGTINAQGGTVVVKAEAANNIVENVINMGGTVNASSASVKGGKIVLGGGAQGTVNVTGTLDASGTTGGDIEVTGQNIQLSESSSLVNEGDSSKTYVYGTALTNFKGALRTGTNAEAEISGRVLELGGDVAMGDGSVITFDPADQIIDATNVNTYTSAMGSGNNTVNIFAENSITLNTLINTSYQTTTSTLNFQDENADTDLTVNLNKPVILGANQTLTGDGTQINVAGDGLIQNAIDIALDGAATVNIADGTYNEDITINKSLDIIGQSTAGTIVTPASHTTGSGTNAASNGWWVVTPGSDVNISNLTFDGDGKQINYGLLFQGSGSVDNAAFKNIGYSRYVGRGIVAWGDGTVDITNTTFDNIQRIGTYYAGAAVSGSIFADNIYTGKGNGDHLDYGVEVERGATDIQILRNTITGNTGVAASDGSTSAGVLATTFFDPNGSAYLEGNVITGNTTAIAIGYDATDATIITAHNNDFSGNDYGVARVGGGTADFSGNWWGTTDEAAIAAYMGGDDADGVDFTPYLVSNLDTDLGTNGFQGDFSNLYVTTLGAQTGATGRIQEAVDAVDVAGTVNANAGTYIEQLTINKSLTMDGVSTDANQVVIQGTGTGNGINLLADDISLRYLTVAGHANGIYTNSVIDNLFMRNVNVRDNSNYGIEIHNNAVVDGMDLRNVRLTNNGVGMRVRGSVNNLDMHGGLVSGNSQGIISVNASGDNTYLTDVNINDVTFTNNALKAIYLEKLSDATFKDLDIRTSGTIGGSSAGIDINLKYGDYQNITLDGTKIRTSATGPSNNALTVKARNDGTYAADAASLTGLTIKNSDIGTIGGYGIAVGNDVSDIDLSDNTVVGTTGAGILVYSDGTNLTLGNNTVSGAAGAGLYATMGGGDVTVAGDVNTNGSSLTLINNGTAFDEQIIVNSGASLLSGNGDTTINSNGGFTVNNGTIDAGTGALAINARQLHLRNGSLTNAASTHLTGGIVTQSAGASLVTPLLTGSLQAYANFLGTNNNIDVIGDFATGTANWSEGGFVLLNAGGRLDVEGAITTDGGDVAITNTANRMDVKGSGSIVTQGGDVDLTVATNAFLYADGTIDTRGASNGDVTLTSGSNIEMRNGGEIFGGLVTLNSGNGVNQATGAMIDADKLEGTVDKAVKLLGTNNAIRTIGNMTTGAHPIASVPGGFTLNNSVGVDVVGNLLGGGDVSLTAAGDINVLSGGAIATDNGNLTINSTTLFDIDAGSSVDLGTGNAHVNAPLVNLGTDINTTGTITGTANTVNVENNTAEIQDGVDVAAAGATVNVAAGTYTENIAIDKSLTLLGQQAGNAYDSRVGTKETTLKGAINIAANTDSVTIDGFTIEDQGVNFLGKTASLYLGNNISNVSVLNNIFDGQDATGDAGRSGIITSSTGSENVLIQGNKFTQARYGIYVNSNADDVRIDSNNFDANRFGIVIQNGGQDTHLTNNTFANNTGSGVYVWSTPVWTSNGNHSAIGTFTGNLFRDNTQHISYLDGNAPDLLVDGDTGNKFWTGSAYETTGEMTVAELFALEDRVTHKMDNSAYGLVVFNTGNLYVTENSGSIQRGVDLSDEGGTLWVGNGTFTESVNVHKAITINGDGTTNTTIVDGTGLDANGFTVAADNVSLNGMIIENFNTGQYNSGIYVDQAVTNLSLHDIMARQNAYAGMYVTENGSIDTLTVSQSHFDNQANRVGSTNDYGYGWYFKKNTNVAATDTVTNVTVTDTTFDGNEQKGIYAEKLDNATFTDVSVFNSGVRLDNPFGNAGIDINLKFGDYQNIVFNRAEVTNGGFTAGSKAGAGISIKARNDGSTYGANPASLSNVVVKNSIVDVTGGDIAIGIGNNVNGVTIANNTNLTAAQGISIYGGVDDITIKGNTINTVGTGTAALDSNPASTHGIALRDSGNAKITGNNLTGEGNGTGIILANSDNVQVGGNNPGAINTIDTYGRGIFVQNSDDARVINNTISNILGNGIMADGIHVQGISNNALIKDNRVTNVGDDGIGVNGIAHGMRIIGNEISQAGQQHSLGEGIEIQSGRGDMLIKNNTISDSLKNGIYVKAPGVGGTFNITGNTVYGVGYNGIKVDAQATNVSGNTVYNTGENGILIADSNDVKVSGNFVGTLGGADNITENGISVTGSNGAVIKDNEIKQTGDNGLFVDASDDVVISNNEIDDIDNAGTHGIFVQNGTNARILNNDIDNVEVNGIYVLNGSGAVIKNNVINDIGTTGSGIAANNHADLRIVDNIITNSLEDGIWVVGGSHNAIISGNDITSIDRNGITLGQSTNVTITDNNIRDIGQDGIQVTGGSNDATIKDNNIEETDRHGVNVVSSDGAVITGNDLTDIGTDGIHAEGSDDLRIVENDILGTTDHAGAGRHGIYVSGGSDALIKENTVKGGDDKIIWGSLFGFPIPVGLAPGKIGAEQHGIYVSNNDRARIIDNDVAKGSGLQGGDATGLDGIRVTGSDDAQIKNNRIDHVGGHGVYLNPSHGSVIHNNEIHHVVLNGIHILDSNDVDVTSNTLYANGQHGIYAENTRDLYVFKNTIGNGLTYGAGDDGIHITGGRNATIHKNTIQGGIALLSGAGRDGIHVVNNREAVITRNTIQGGLALATGAERHGIYAENSGSQLSGLANIFSSRDGVQITGNIITNGPVSAGAGEDGIHVVNSAGGGFGDAALIENNVVNDVGNNGIYVDDTAGVDVTGNKVNEAGANGIQIDGSGLASVTDNRITDVLGHGIIMSGGAVNVISDNRIDGTGDDGIYASGVLGLFITDNKVNNADDDGIDVRNATGLVITGNRITDVDDDGIAVEGGTLAFIDDNRVIDAGGNGIAATGSANAFITNNRLRDIDDDGIDLSGSNNATIDNNRLADIGDDGIDVESSDDVEITNNRIREAGGDGIDVSDSEDAVITDNRIRFVGDDGIDLDNSDDAQINNNRIIGAWSNGIEVTDSFDTDILENRIRWIGNDGINVDGSFGADIRENSVAFAGGDGIDVDDSAFVDVNDNNVRLVLGNGIKVEDSFAADIIGNIIRWVAQDGIDVEDSSFADIADNRLRYIGDDGIDVEGGIGVDITDNRVRDTLGDGIETTDSNFLDITGNRIRYTGDDGIDVLGSDDVEITGNNVRYADENGIEVTDSNTILIDDNISRDNGEAGIFVDPSTGIIILNNSVSGNEIGIHLDDVDDVTVSDNTITDNQTGLYASSQNNGSIILSGNSFTDNETGAEFESGEIDLTGDTNSFTGGSTGMIFDPTAGGDPLNLSLVSDGEPGFGGTLGTTVFEGLTDPGDNFIVLANGAFFDPGTPTLIDARYARFNGVSASDDPGGDFELEAFELNEIESRIFHWNDLNSLGLIIFGYLDSVPVIQQEDLLQYFTQPNLQLTNLNVTFNGMPRIPGAPQNLNNITPFAGGNSAEDLNNITPSAGGDGTAQSLNEIETAAGGNQAACWGDAIGMAQGGQTVNISYGGTTEDLLNAAAGCQSGL